MTKAAVIAPGLLYFNHCFPFRPFDLSEDQLRNAIARLNHLFLVRKVDQYHLDLPAVIRIDGARRVKAGNSLLDCKSAPWPYLHFVSPGQLDKKTGRHHRAL